MSDTPPPMPRRSSQGWFAVLVGVPLVVVTAAITVVVMVARPGLWPCQGR